MAVTTYTLAPFFVPSKSDVWVNQRTNNIDTAARSSINLTLTDAAAGQTLTVFWASNSLIFTFAAVPDGSGVQLVEKGALSVAAWIEALYYQLILNADLTGVFLVEYTATYIKLIYKDYDSTSVTATKTATGTITVDQKTTAGYLKKNLSAFMRARDSAGNIIADFNVPYSLTDQRAYFNLRSIYRRLVPHVPTSAMFQYHATTVAELCSGSVMLYRLLVADKYSVTNTALPTVEKLEDHNGDYYAINAQQLRGIVGDIIAMNPDYTRIVTPTQPNFIYFLATFPITTVTIRAIITLKSGAPVTIDRTISSVTKGQAYAVKAGLTQLYNGDYNNVKSYEVQIRNGSTVAFSATYSIPAKCTSDVINVLVEMPNGGFETVSLRGKAIDATNSEREQAQITRNQNYSTQSGDITEYGKSTQQEWRITTGLINKSEYPIYSAMLTGDLYIINADNTLEKITLDSKKMDFDRTAQAFGLVLKSAVVNEL